VIVGIIDPHKLRCELIEVSTFNHALAAAGLQQGSVDHGTIYRRPGWGGLARVCYELALYVPLEKQKYFSLPIPFSTGPHILCAGPHVIYRFDDTGETVDMDEMVPVMFYKNIEQIERAIENEVVARPFVAFGKKVLWTWPEPATDPDILQRMRAHNAL
jgi:hypothetical protein